MMSLPKQDDARIDTTVMDLPRFADLPGGSAWGLWDKDGEQDQLGTLNLLTRKIKLEAAKEVRDGISVSLKYYMLPTVPYEA